MNMSLIEYLDNKLKSCTHLMVVKNGENPGIEAILSLTPDVLKQLHDIWTRQYYEIQQKRAVLNHQRKYHYKIAKKGN